MDLAAKAPPAGPRQQFKELLSASKPFNHTRSPLQFLEYSLIQAVNGGPRSLVGCGGRTSLWSRRDLFVNP